jgi:hypothetical protein
VTEYYFLYTKYFWQNGENSPPKKISGKNKNHILLLWGTNGLQMKAEEGCDISHQQSQRYIRGYCVKVRMKKKRKSVYKRRQHNNQAKLLTHWEEDCFAISAAQHRSSSSSSNNNTNNNNNEVV